MKPKDVQEVVGELINGQRNELKKRINEVFGKVEKHAMDDVLYEVVNMQIHRSILSEIEVEE